MSRFNDKPSFPVIYKSLGVNIDFSNHKAADIDVDAYVEKCAIVQIEDSPVTLLELTSTISGGAQTITYPAPAIDDVNIAGSLKLLGVDIALQLNAFDKPKTDISLKVDFLDSLGDAIGSLAWNITGNASVNAGDTRQYIRIIPVEQNSVFSPTTGSTTTTDGKSVFQPVFGLTSSTAISLLKALKTPAFSNNELRSMFPFMKTVSAIKVTIPAGAMVAGAGLTITPITAGRTSTIAEITDAAEVGDLSNVKFIDLSNNAAVTNK